MTRWFMLVLNDHNPKFYIKYLMLKNINNIAKIKWLQNKLSMFTEYVNILMGIGPLELMGYRTSVTFFSGIVVPTAIKPN